MVLSWIPSRALNADCIMAGVIAEDGRAVVGVQGGGDTTTDVWSDWLARLLADGTGWMRRESGETLDASDWPSGSERRPPATVWRYTPAENCSSSAIGFPALLGLCLLPCPRSLGVPRPVRDCSDEVEWKENRSYEYWSALMLPGEGRG